MSVHRAVSDADIRRCFAVLHELRPHFDESAFLVQTRRQMADPNWRLAFLEEDGAVVAVTGFRLMECYATGKTLYVDDLVTHAGQRSRGHGQTLMAWLEQAARAEGCRTLALDSGTQRTLAHKFYFRLGFAVLSFRFLKAL